VTNASQIMLTLNVRDETYQEVDFADVELQIDTPDGQKLPIQMEPTPGQLGQYQATFSPREQGAYLATITAKDSLGVLIGTDETGWASQPAAEEFRTLSPNRDLLEQLAEKSGGELVELENLNSFITSLKSRKLPVMRSIVHPLWHRPSVFLFAVLCFAGEWGIRRWRGVA